MDMALYQTTANMTNYMTNLGSAVRLVIVPDAQALTAPLGSGTLLMWSNVCRFISNNVTPLNIAGVLSVGDMNDVSDAGNWSRTMSQWNMLANIPHVVAPGNHDYNTIAAPATRDLTLFTANLGPTWYTNKTWFKGGFMSNSTDNIYTVVEKGGIKLLLMALEFGPRTNTLLWASNVVASYPAHTVVLATHAFLDTNATYSASQYQQSAYLDDTCNGPAMWSHFKHWRNLRFVFSGHFLPTAAFPSETNATFTGVYGQPIDAYFSNYQITNQCRPKVLTFYPSSSVAKLDTYDAESGAWSFPGSRTLDLSTYPYIPPAVTTNIAQVIGNTNAWEGLVFGVNFDGPFPLRDRVSLTDPTNSLNPNTFTRTIGVINDGATITNGLCYPIAPYIRDEVTVSCWLKMTYDQYLKITNNIFNVAGQFTAGTDGSWYMGIANPAFNSYDWYAVKLNCVTNGVRGDVKANYPSNVVDGFWHHMAITYKTNIGATFYYDGYPILTNASTISQFSNPGTKPIMTHGFPAAVDGMPGGASVDQLAVFSRSLSANEILYAYKSEGGSYITTYAQGAPTNAVTVKGWIKVNLNGTNLFTPCYQ